MNRPAETCRPVDAVSPRSVSTISIVAVAVLSAVASVVVPGPAAACGGAAPRVAVSVALPFPPAPPPWVVAALPPPFAVAGAAVSPSVYFAWLDANRAAYRARWGWNPWRMARYDAWYHGHRAELDARWTPQPARMAWAPSHGRGHGKHGGRDHHDD